MERFPLYVEMMNISTAHSWGVLVVYCNRKHTNSNRLNKLARTVPAQLQYEMRHCDSARLYLIVLKGNAGNMRKVEYQQEVTRDWVLGTDCFCSVTRTCLLCNVINILYQMSGRVIRMLRKNTGMVHG